MLGPLKGTTTPTLSIPDKSLKWKLDSQSLHGAFITNAKVNLGCQDM